MVNYLTKNQIKALYRKKLRPRMRKMEAERLEIRSKIITSSTIFILIFGFIFYKLNSGSGMSLEANFDLIKLSVFVGFIILGFYFRRITKAYRSKFKQSIVKEMFNLLIQDCNFNPDNHMTEGDFNRCDLITSHYNRFSGEDHVTGKIGSVGLEFSELKVSHVTGSGKNRSETIHFDGLFFKCTFRNKIKSPLLIHSDLAERTFGRTIGRFFQKKAKPGYELVQLESVEFEKHFAVYTKDQVHARVMLNPLTMDRLTSFLKKYKEKIEISIIDHNLYFMLHNSKNHFEPAIFSQPIKWKDVMEMYDILSLIAELIDQFNLNKRIKNNNMTKKKRQA